MLPTIHAAYHTFQYKAHDPNFKMMDNDAGIACGGTIQIPITNSKESWSAWDYVIMSLPHRIITLRNSSRTSQNQNDEERPTTRTCISSSVVKTTCKFRHNDYMTDASHNSWEHMTCVQHTAPYPTLDTMNTSLMVPPSKVFLFYFIIG